eukprot:CAMPEP_0119013872 /NCGR_PEP_ID=MMETSP1176-20130426/9152_1 /TAXON_ID=265551 /ORGANISM="Synedropsis recta cf, Strain CCMP1620" /LENGTH=270 /DNA_ID=CAMNT_0006966997 /DNA_START=45 /DNA_END=857 /DNA_ORIENTATION=+
MDFQLKDKLVVVTGSTGDGIGVAIAKEFAKLGATVVVNGRKQESLDATVEQLQEFGTVIGVAGDVGSLDGVNKFIKDIEAVEESVGTPVECLINNVGIFHSQDFVDIPDDKWMDYYQINTMSGVRLSRHFLPKMLERDSGRIIFISSECGLRPLPNMLAYGVSKTSQIALARGLSEMTKGTKVTVNSVLPGPTMTGGIISYMKDFGEQNGFNSLDKAVSGYFAEHETTSLLQRFLDPSEIANVVVFLSSPLASGINGAAQHVDGGIVRHI